MCPYMNARIQTSCNDIGRRIFFPKENRSTPSPCQNAPPQARTKATGTEVAVQAPLPPDEHKAVRWEGGDRRKRQAQTAAEKRCSGDCGIYPMKRKSMLVIPCNKLFCLIRGRILSSACGQLNGWMPTVMYGGWVMNASKMLQSDMPYTTLFIYLLLMEKQWYPRVCMNVSTPGKAIAFNARLNEVNPVCWNARGGPGRKEPFPR